MATETARGREPEPFLTDHPGPICRALAKLFGRLDPIAAFVDDAGREFDASRHLPEGVLFEILRVVFDLQLGHIDDAVEVAEDSRTRIASLSKTSTNGRKRLKLSS